MRRALERLEEATKEVGAAQREVAALKEEAAAGTANCDADSGSVVAEARALLEVLETAPLTSTAGSKVVPERVLAQMRKLRQTLQEHDYDGEEADVEELAEHVDTGDELDSELPGRCTLRGNSRLRASSAGVASRRRIDSTSRTPPPDSALRRKLGY